MKMHRVISKTADLPTDEFMFFSKSEALAKVDWIKQFIKIEDGDIVSHDTVEVNTLAKQTVFVEGRIIGFQFSQTKYGARTAFRNVRNLRTMTTDNPFALRKQWIQGTITFLNKKREVIYYPSEDRWVVIC